MDYLKEKFCKIEEIHKSLSSTIFSAVDIESKQRVVIKLKSQESECLKNEINIYKRLQNDGDSRITPKLLWTRDFENGHSAFAVEELGLNLEQLYDAMNRQMSEETLLRFGELMIKCVKELHSLGVLHCDIRPENFLLGRSAETQHLYLIGFSRAELIGEYKTPEISKRISRRASFQSLLSQLGFKYGYRDDLESIGLILAYFYEGQLPWQGVLVEDDETRFDIIARIKSQIKHGQLYWQLPEKFKNYFKLCWKLKPDEIPDYDKFLNIFRKFQSSDVLKLDKATDCYDDNHRLKRTKSQILATAILDPSNDDFKYFSE